jgi:4-amino-4-deoxy-L-arabinose transferase-like glycosyltransferase
MKDTFRRLPLTTIILCLSVCISIFLHTYRMNDLCLNEDEAAQGYNTYSVLQTGYDEYGRLPLRYLSFGENKLPLTGILSAPFIALGGLNTLSVRLPVLLIGMFLPLLFYGAAYTLTKSKVAAVVACFFSSANVWINTTSRHQHEAVILSAIVLLFIIAIYRVNALNTRMGIIRLAVLFFMGLYTYHSGKMIMPFLGLTTVLIFWKKNRKAVKWIILSLGTVALIFGITELIQPNNRVANLSYFTAPVFTYEIEEGRRAGGSTLYYNKVVYGATQAIQRTFGYLSPGFLLQRSDPNPRYGSPDVHLLTVVEYLLVLLGFVMLWLKKHIHRIFLSFLLFVAIIPAAAALPTDSNTRSFVLTVPLILIMSIGAHYAINYLNAVKERNIKVFFIILGCFTIIIHLSFLFQSWKAYFVRYLKDERTLRSWQCGTKEMSDYVWQNYDKFEHFVITRAYGQPYIFLLFNKPYPPDVYQKIAKQGTYNEYGFWEQDSFDKFTFRSPNIAGVQKSTAFIMTPEEVTNNKLDKKKLYPVTHNGVARFYVQENL